MADPLTPEERAELRAKAEAATPGKRWRTPTSPRAVLAADDDVCAWFGHIDDERACADAAFTEKADAETVLRLLADLERAEGEREAMEQERDAALSALEESRRARERAQERERHMGERFNEAVEAGSEARAEVERLREENGRLHMRVSMATAFDCGGVKIAWSLRGWSVSNGGCYLTTDGKERPCSVAGQPKENAWFETADAAFDALAAHRAKDPDRG